MAEALNVKPERISESTAVGDFPMWDSLGHLDVIMQVEKALGVEFDITTTVGIQNVADIIVAVEERQ